MKTKNLFTCLALIIVTLGYGQNTYPWPSAGNVAIGIDNPGGKMLYVRANNSDHSSIIENINTSGWGIIFNSANDPLRVGPLGDYTGGYFKVSGNGNVGIGVTSPSARLHILDGGFRHGGTGEINIDAVGIMGGRFRILDNGNVGIGTPNPGNFKLAVEGKIGAREINVTTASWSDYVFDSSYQLRPLGEVQQYIKQNKHLPEIPSEIEVKTNGQDLGEMNKLLLMKIEELTLYMIDMKKQNEVLTQRVQRLENK